MKVSLINVSAACLGRIVGEKDFGLRVVLMTQHVFGVRFPGSFGPNKFQSLTL